MSVTSVLADHFPIDKRIDIRNYEFHIIFSDKSNEINATAFVAVYFNQSGVKQFRLDFTNKGMNRKGMLVDSISAVNKTISYTHTNNALLINLV
ncbi:MAG: hypothetical protein SGI83_18465 [Bacteroidota bacterium]|nr:hypothetical protein [Bacteroidota bacterium]